MLFSSFAQVVMMVVALIAFLTVVAVIWVGAQENTSAHAEGSDAAAAWAARAEKKEQALRAQLQAQGQGVPSAEAVADTVESEQSVSEPSGETTNQSVSDLSDEEKEAKRRAALERRAARAAKKAAEG